MPQLQDLLSEKKFTLLIECLTHLPQQHQIPSTLAGFPCCLTLADRVHSDHDPAPIEVAAEYPQQEKVLHFAGKGKDIQDLEQFLDIAQSQGLKNLLLLTGDKLKHHDFDANTRTRYLESVNAVMAAKARAYFCIGVAFNPFKYRRAEQDAQYFKLHKKLQAGADYLITQLGYDLNKLRELKDFLQQHHYQHPIFACVMPLTLGRAKFMRRAKVAGIVITDHMLDVLEQEKQLGLTDYAERRAALQILICQHLGFAGVHLSSCHSRSAQQALAAYIEEYRTLSLEQCEQLWHELWQIKTGQEFVPHYAWHEEKLSVAAKMKYQQLHVMHDAVFASKLAKRVGRVIFKAKVWDKKAAGHGLIKAELISKHRVVGCESCGQCRLADTLYVCPETCPKGLANGPCGGTEGDRCEFGDRECIHSVKARLANEMGQSFVLKHKLIPTVPIEVRGSSSWKNWYLS